MSDLPRKIGTKQRISSTSEECKYISNEIDEIYPNFSSKSTGCLKKRCQLLLPCDFFYKPL